MAARKPGSRGTGDHRLDYLHRMGLTDVTASDLIVPDVGTLRHDTDHPMEFIGEDLHPDFEYYRAVYSETVESCKRRGWVALPSSADVRMRGGSTERETIMARLKTVGDVHRQAAFERRQAQRRGESRTTTPLRGGGNEHIDQQVTRSTGPNPGVAIDGR